MIVSGLRLFWIEYDDTQFKKIDRKYDAFLSTYLLPCFPHPTTPMNIVKNDQGTVG